MEIILTDWLHAKNPLLNGPQQYQEGAGLNRDRSWICSCTTMYLKTRIVLCIELDYYSQTSGGRLDLPYLWAKNAIFQQKFGLKFLAHASKFGHQMGYGIKLLIFQSNQLHEFLNFLNTILTLTMSTTLSQRKRTL